MEVQHAGLFEWLIDGAEGIICTSTHGTTAPGFLYPDPGFDENKFWVRNKTKVFRQLNC